MGLQPVFSQNLSSEDKEKIRYEAASFIEEFELLLNTLALPDLSKLERDELIGNSYVKSGNQIFTNKDVVVEDDIDPNYSSYTKVKDVNVDRYLKDLDIFYVKSEAPTIEFSNIITSNVKQDDYVYLEVYFESQFKSRHVTIKKPYQKTKRVATLMARKKSRNWEMLIASVVFYDPLIHKVNTKGKILNIIPTRSENKTTVKSDPMPIPVTTSSSFVFPSAKIVTIGAGLGYGFGLNQVGLGIHGQYYFADYLVGQMGFHFFEKEDTKENWSFNLNANYYFETNSPTQPYVILGLNVLKQTIIEEKKEKSGSFAGMNIGAGIDFEQANNIIYFGHMKFATTNSTDLSSHFLLMVGLRYKIKW